SSDRPPNGLPESSHQAYTVDRSTFREALKVTLGKFLTHYTSLKNKVTAFFDGGASEDGALLVGANGVRSKARKQYVPAFEGLDTGMRIIFGKTPLTSECIKKLPKQYLHGMSMVKSDDDASQPVLLFEGIYFPRAEEISEVQIPYLHIYWFLIVHCSLIPFSDEEMWHSSAKDSKSNVETDPFLGSMGLKPRFRSLLSALTDIAPWEPSDLVTPLGDAIHVMPPTAAMGANTALRDAADLAHRITAAENIGSMGKALIGAYESEMREFAVTIRIQVERRHERLQSSPKRGM
ncbi:hypothetical protein N7462_005485, partial [Penicillium macrosclerotiorum]|uniref:uncharacterized protein n=1 Tax=Penicillium macrosclerotiorum TaxID=303699 RepID=UPI002548C2FA